MKTKSLLFFSIIFLSVACKKNSLEHPVLDCIGNANDQSIPIGFCEEENLPNQYCEAEDFGEGRLKSESKIFMPQYCKSIGSQITFTNASGEAKNFELRSKSYSFIPFIYNTFEPCSEDQSKNKGICFKTDAVRITIAATEGPEQFKLRLNTALGSNLDGTFGDFLNISYRVDSITWNATFRIIVNQQSLDHNMNEYQEFHENLTLNDNSYEAVMSYDISNIPGENYKFYYTKDEGLIGFIDLDGITWTLSP